MKRKARRFSDKERDIIWKRWKQGDSLKAIGKSLDRLPENILNVLEKNGGVKQLLPRRAPTALSFREREEISRGLSAGLTLRKIAQNLERSPSTISREVKRHGGVDAYRAESADKAAWANAKRPKPCKLAQKPLQNIVVDKLMSDWSPQQISGWLKREFPNDESLQVSHETIYKSLYIQARGVLKKELLKQLRSKPRIRATRHSSKGQRGIIPGLVSISERPPGVEDRAVPGHWEGDLIAGSKQSFIATLVERHSRFVCLVKVNNKTTQEVISKLIKHADTIPDHLYQSLTWDRGSELKRHHEFTLATDIDVYFCDPQSPWQRGTNENTNRLLRQYFPKGTDLSKHSQAKLNEVARRLNERPRKTLDYETPAECFMKCVASTG